MTAIRNLNDVTPMHFVGEVDGPDNNYNSLPALLRSVADYMDAHPEYNGTGFFDLTVHHESGDTDETYFTATLYAYEDDDHARV